MIKRPPSECGEFETGCHSAVANNLALIATSWSEFNHQIHEEVLPEWELALNDMQVRMLNTSREVLERFSLGWLLAEQKDLFDAIYDAAWLSADVEDPSCQPIEPEPEVIRDWFCWLHRELVSLAKSNQRQTTHAQER